MTEYKSFDVCLSYKMVIMFFQELITLSYTATSCQFHMSWQWLKNEIELYLERHSWGPASNIWVHCAAALCTETYSERHDHLTRITTTKALSRPTSRTHSFLVVCALCNLGCLSARNSAHQLKKHQNRRRDKWDSVRGQRLRTGWRPARRGKEGVPGRCARWAESRALRCATAHDTRTTKRE